MAKPKSAPKPVGGKTKTKTKKTSGGLNLGGPKATTPSKSGKGSKKTGSKVPKFGSRVTTSGRSRAR